MTAKRARRRNRRRREKEGEEAEEEGNRTNEMFPITGVGEDRSCAWIDLRDREVERKREVWLICSVSFFELLHVCSE